MVLLGLRCLSGKFWILRKHNRHLLTQEAEGLC